MKKQQYTVEIGSTYICRARKGLHSLNQSTLYTLKAYAGAYRLEINGEGYTAIKQPGNNWNWSCNHNGASQVYLPALSRALDMIAEPEPAAIAQELRKALESGELVEICHTHTEYQPLYCYC